MFLLFLHKPALSQGVQAPGAFSFVSIGKDQGLFNQQVTAVFQDSYGFIWLGTQGGLFRFDGYQCLLFENTPGDSTSIPSNFIAYGGFYEDQNNDLWIGTNDAGVARFNRKTEQFRGIRKQNDGRPGLRFEGIADLCGDSFSGFWIATMGGGLSHYFPQQDSFVNYVLPDNRHDTLMGSNLVLALRHDRSGRLWIGTGNGAAILQPDGTFQRFFPDPEQPGRLSADFVYDIFQDSKNEIWLATRSGLNRWVAPNSFARYYPEDDPDVPKGLGYNLVYRVFEDTDGDYWLGTKAGLLHFDPDRNDFKPEFHDPLDPASIPDGEIHNIFQDKAGNLWFASNEGVRVLNKKTALYKEEKWLLEQAFMLSEGPKNGILDLLEHEGRFWFTTEKGLFTFRRGERLQKLIPGAFTKLFPDRQGRLWAGTLQEYLYLVDPRQLRVIKKFPKQLKNTHSHAQCVGIQNSCFAEDLSGKIWAGTKSVLNRYDPITGAWQQFYANPAAAASLSNAVINDLYLDRRGNLWIATNAGVNFLSREALQKPVEDTTLTFFCYQHNPGDDNSLGNNRVRAIFEDSRGWMWFGTDMGLHVLGTDGRWRRFFRKNGLPGNKITSVLEDKEGNIWVSTASDGLSKFDIQAQRFLNFSKRDGLSTEQFPSGASLKMGDGKLFFAGLGGASCFDPEKISVANQEAPLYITAFKLFNQPVAVGMGNSPLQQPPYMTPVVELDYAQNVISFQFAALNFISPEKQTYRFRLTPFQTDWQYIGNRREATFTNLDPGVYQLHVETSENNYDWTGKTLTLRVLPPWYRTAWAYLLYLAAGLALLFIVRRYELRRQLAKAEVRHFRELDLAKTRLYANITHEFRTPLTVILGMEEQLRRDPGAWLDEGLRLIRRNGKQLLHLVNQLLDLAKLESGHLPLRLVQGDVVAYIRYLMESFHSYADSKDIRLHFRSDLPELIMDHDPEKLQTVVSNLLSNAIKFTPPGGDIYIDLRKTVDDGRATVDAPAPSIVLQIEDTGPGIAPGHLPYIFDRFYQADDASTRRVEGTGIGLALVKELVRLMGGSITAQGEPGKGARFSIQLPVTRKAAPKEAALQPETVEALDGTVLLQPASAAETPPVDTADRYTVLLVEDNQDVITYLSSVLRTNYRIVTARNGQEGIDKALELVPDVIVSDVMMPVRDGFDLCRTLKADERSSHIPIILLTARADQPSKLEGLSLGADVYLAKPFHREELLIRLEKLIELRRRLQARFQQTGSLTTAINDKAQNADDVFLQKILRLVEAHMGNEDFGMPQLCKALNMSRTNLFRKLKALTGKSATDFIRQLRLERAKALLETTEMNVTEVSYAVGFGSPSYFSRAFQEAFGVAPGKVRKG